jgi:two-component system, chemotaxis family, sensor kinase Cph1
MEREAYQQEKKNKLQNDIDKILKEINELDQLPDQDINKLKVQYTELSMENMNLKKSINKFESSKGRYYLDLYNSASVGYFSLDKKGIIKDLNKRGSSLLGLKDENMIDTDFINYIAPNFRTIFQENLYNSANTHKKQSFEINIIEQGDLLFAEIEIIPYIDEKGEIKEFNIFLVDISEYKKSEIEIRSKYENLKEKMKDRVDELLRVNESLEKIISKNELSDKKLRASEKREQARSEEFARVLDAVPAAVWISHDKDGLWITGNQLSYDYLDIQQGSNASKSLPPNERPETFKIFKDGKEMAAGAMPVQLSSAGHEIRNYEFDLVYPDKKIRHLMGNATPLFDENGNPRGSVSAFIDVTENKDAEIRMAELLKELERSNKELEQFAYVTSHDLKEPLRMVTSFTQLLENRYKGKMDSDADEFIEYIIDGTLRMQQLLDDLLAYSKITNEVKYEPIELNGVIKESINNLKVAIDESDAEINYTTLPPVVANRTQMIQLFQNLIANAIKFQSTKKPIISISSKKKGQKYIFSVKDNGIGIDSKYQKRIFMVFQRLHTNEEYEGTGIGLSITKKIVAQHNGAIWVKSKIGRGSTFYFTLPIITDKMV